MVDTRIKYIFCFLETAKLFCKDILQLTFSPPGHELWFLCILSSICHDRSFSDSLYISILSTLSFGKSYLAMLNFIGDCCFWKAGMVKKSLQFFCVLETANLKGPPCPCILWYETHFLPSLWTPKILFMTLLFTCLRKTPSPFRFHWDRPHQLTFISCNSLFKSSP